MKINIDTKEGVINMEPVFVTAPTGRNGITLLQRLLNSSKQIIVYGENNYLVNGLPRQLLQFIQMLNSKEEFDDALDVFLNDNLDGWTSNLWPDVTGYVSTAIENAYQFYDYYSNFSKENNFYQWGIKNPMDNPDMIHNLRILFKRARFIFIYRNIFDVVRSAKARRFITGSSDLEMLAERWQYNLLPILKKEIKGVLCIKYEDLVQNPEPEIKKIELFAQVSGIDRTILNRKINTFKGDTKDGHSPSNYIKPEEITPHEIEIICKKASGALKLTSYQPYATLN